MVKVETFGGCIIISTSHFMLMMQESKADIVFAENIKLGGGGL